MWERRGGEGEEEKGCFYSTCLFSFFRSDVSSLWTLRAHTHTHMLDDREHLHICPRMLVFYVGSTYVCAHLSVGVVRTNTARGRGARRKEKRRGKVD